MLNFVIIMGRLTADVELKTTTTGLSVARFTVAVERNYKTGDKRETDFIDCVAWRGTADFVSRYFKKGQMIAIQGRIETHPYEDKNNNKRKSVEIIADNVSFCGGKNESASNTYAAVPDLENGFSVLPDESMGVPFDADDEEGLPF